MEELKTLMSIKLEILFTKQHYAGGDNKVLATELALKVTKVR